MGKPVVFRSLIRFLLIQDLGIVIGDTRLKRKYFKIEHLDLDGLRLRDRDKDRLLSEK